MTRSEFQRIYEDIFPNGDSKMFADHVFRTYDNDSNGYIDFQVRMDINFQVRFNSSFIGNNFSFFSMEF